MTFSTFDSWWWPFVFILVAGWLATDFWRFAGVLLGNRLDENSRAFVLVRAVATALVAAVIARLVIHPSGALGETALWLRLSAAAAGFIAFKLTGERIAAGVGAGVVVLVAGMALGF